MGGAPESVGYDLPMSSTERRHPRLGVDLPGALEFPGTSDRVPVTVRGLSAGGVALDVDAPGRALVTQGAAVVILFDVHGFSMSLPARVVWCDSSDSEAAHVGAELQLDTADAGVRRSYEAWIKHALFEDRFESSRRPATRPPTH